MLQKKNDSGDSPVWFGIAGAIMVIAGVIWFIASNKSGNSTYDLYAMLCLAVGGYCFISMIRLIRKKRGGQ